MYFKRYFVDFIWQKRCTPDENCDKSTGLESLKKSCARSTEIRHGRTLCLNLSFVYSFVFECYTTLVREDTHKCLEINSGEILASDNVCFFYKFLMWFENSEHRIFISKEHKSACKRCKKITTTAPSAGQHVVFTNIPSEY